MESEARGEDMREKVIKRAARIQSAGLRTGPCSCWARDMGSRIGAWGSRNVLLVSTSLVEMNRPRERGTRDGATALQEGLEQKGPQWNGLGRGRGDAVFRHWGFHDDHPAHKSTYQILFRIITRLFRYILCLKAKSTKALQIHTVFECQKHRGSCDTKVCNRTTK